LFVGYTEIKLQLDATVTDSHGNSHRRRASGDGHDSMVPKLIEFALSLPFTVGLKSKITARCLAGVLILEALTSWIWFLSKVRAQLKVLGCPMTHSEATRASQSAASHSPLTWRCPGYICGCFGGQLNIGYRIHAREHFMVNIGVAGALIMFAYMGPGKYSVDAYMKKRD